MSTLNDLNYLKYLQQDYEVLKSKLDLALELAKKHLDNYDDLVQDVYADLWDEHTSLTTTIKQYVETRKKVETFLYNLQNKIYKEITLC